MLSRRGFLGALAACASLPTGVMAGGDRPIYAGWLDDQAARRAFTQHVDRPYFRQHAGEIKGTGRNTQVLLWKYYEKCIKGPFVPHFQDFGDCVSHAMGLGCDFLAASQIARFGLNEEWKGKCSTEAIFGGSRVEIGKGALRSEGGSTGAWAAEWVSKYGVLPRGRYGKYDLTQYAPELAKYWGRRGVGVPDELEPIIKQHPIKTVTRVEDWDQACDLVANGYPVVLASSVGYRMQTDAEGFLLRSRKPWYHATLLIAIDTKSKRQGGCIANSWGTNWISGPAHALGTPKGCFWADARNIDAMLSQEDSYGISQFVGYPKQAPDYNLW